MQFDVLVKLKGEVLDTQGRAIRDSLHRLGQPVEEIKVSKVFHLTMDSSLTDEAAYAKAEEIARSFLANTVAENFEILPR